MPGANPALVGGSGGLSLAVTPVPQVTAFPTVNTINLGGSTYPGRWTLHRADHVFGWQIQQGYGLTGATIFPKGDPLVVAEFRVDFWAQADFLIFRQLRKLQLTKAALAAPGGILSLAMGIDHPELNAMGVDTVVLGKVGAAIQQPDGGAGLWEVRIEFIQYRPPIPAIKKPTQKIPAVAAAPPIANSANSAQIAALTAQLQALQRP